MKIETFKKAEKILDQIDELQNTIESIKFALDQIEKGEVLDDFFVLFGFDKKQGVHLGQKKEDDLLLLQMLENKKNKLKIDFENL